MNVKHIRYVTAILEEGSITRAAKKLYISQPSLSQMLKLIESDLGAPIFNRNTDPMTLTYVGEKYMEAARQILSISHNLTREIQETQKEQRGLFRLGIPVQRGMEVLPYVLSYFKNHYAQVELRILEQGSDATEKLLLEGKLDMACLTTYPKHQAFEYLLIEKEEPVLLSGLHTRLAATVPDGTPIQISQASQELFVSTKEGHSTRITQDWLFSTYHLNPRILLETSSIEVGKRAAIACDAVMICPRNYLQTTPNLLTQCNVYPIKGIKNHRHFYLCYEKNLYLTSYLKDFIQIMKQKKYRSVT